MLEALISINIIFLIIVMFSLDKLRKKTTYWTITVFDRMNQQEATLKQQNEEIDNLKHKLKITYLQ